MKEVRSFAGCPMKEARISVKEPPQVSSFLKNHISIRCGAPYVLWFCRPSSHLGALVPLLNVHLVTNRRQLVTLLFTIQQLKIKLVGPPLR